MKKLMLILASLTITTTGASTAVACKQSDKRGEIKDYTGIPNANSIKEKIKAEGYNPNDFDVDIQAGMKTAIVRFMPDAENISFYSKTISLNWSTTDINSIITLKSLPYITELGDPMTAEKALAAVNLLNGTAFTTSELDVQVDNTTHDVTLTPKENSGFTGSPVQIINDLITFPDVFTVQNIGDIYITEEMWNNYLADPTGTSMNMIAAIMEFVGDRNRFAGLYKSAMTIALTNALFNSGLTLTIDQNSKVGTLIIDTDVSGVVSPSKITANFSVKTTARKYLTPNNEKPTGNYENPQVYNLNMPKKYSETEYNQLRYDVVKEYLGQEFADKYKDILYDEVLITKDSDTSVILTPKAGSKIFEISDLSASNLTGLPVYSIKVTFPAN